MTLVDSITGLAGFFDKIYLFVLVNPASGENVVSVSSAGVGQTYVYASAVSYTGANQTGQPPHTNKGSTASATSYTLSIDTSASPSTDNCWFVGAYYGDGNYTASAGTGTTLRTTTETVRNWVGFVDNNVAITPPGSDSIVVAYSVASQIAIVGASIAPVSAVAPSVAITQNNLAMLGVS
jgi:hypothetical protein